MNNNVLFAPVMNSSVYASSQYPTFNNGPYSSYAGYPGFESHTPMTAQPFYRHQNTTAPSNDICFVFFKSLFFPFVFHTIFVFLLQFFYQLLSLIVYQLLMILIFRLLPETKTIMAYFCKIIYSSFVHLYIFVLFFMIDV